MTAPDVTLDRTSIPERLEAYEATRRKGVAFLLEHIAEDGRVAESDRPRISYYRFPWALAVSGETTSAFRVLRWIERTGLGEDGQFHGGVTWDATANRTTNTYPETILAFGALLLRRIDIGRRTMGFAKRYQDSETGGIWMSREETGSDGPQLLFPTAQFGMSAVMTGDMEAAIRTGEWFARLWAAQPGLPGRLYTVWTRAGGLSTSVPKGENIRHFIQESQEERQLHYNGGIAAAFLTQLFMATGDRRWLDLARGYQQFSMDSCPEQFRTKQVCKSAWGSGLLYLATGDPLYLPWLQKMGDWFVGGQESDGGWRNTPYLEADPPLAHRLEITAEFVVHLDTVIAALSAAEADQRLMTG
jgi:hypothetical protein